MASEQLTIRLETLRRSKIELRAAVTPSCEGRGVARAVANSAPVAGMLTVAAPPPVEVPVCH